MTFGESLKRFRNSLGLNQKEFADSLGMKPPLYQRYESGKTTPSVDFIYKMTTTYDVSADYLLGLSDEPRHAPISHDEKEIKEAIEFRDTWLKMQRLEAAVKARQVPTQ